MRKTFSISFRIGFLLLCLAGVWFLSVKAVEIDQAAKIIKDLNNARAIYQSGYTVQQHQFTTVVHIQKPVTPFLCQRILKGRLPFPHLVYADGKIVNTLSANACKNVKFLSIQFANKRPFAHMLECLNDSQCETSCHYGFCVKEENK